MLLAAVALFATGLSSAQTPIWSEEFDAASALHCGVWSFETGDGCAQGICGWGNAEFQIYTDDEENARIENGHLVISAQRQTVNGPQDPGADSYTFTSARIKTQNRLTLQYGTVEARIKAPDVADGLWPAFWTLGTNHPTAGWPACGEIDIFEMGTAASIAEGVVRRRVGSTAHWDNNGSYAGYGLTYTSPTDLNDNFHIYRMEWTPTFITTYIDGIWIWSIDISNPASFSGEEFHQPHFLILNLAVGGNFTGITGDSALVTAPFPAEYRVDWIRIYDNGFTTLGGIGPQVQVQVTPAGPDVEISFGTQLNVNYDVRYKVNVTDPTWTLLQSVVGDGTVMSVFDPVTSPARYYVVESSE